MIATVLLYTSTFLCGLFTFLHLTWLYWKRKYSFIPHAPNVPWLGSIPYIGTTAVEFTTAVISFSKQFDHLYLLWIGPFPVIRVGCADYAEGLLRSQETSRKSDYYFALKPTIGDGLILSYGKKWKQRRTALTPSFHFSILRDFCDAFEVHSKRLVDVLKKHENEVVEVQHLASLSTLDVICATSMGVDLIAFGSSGADYVRNLRKVNDLMLLRTLNPFMEIDFLYRLTSNGKAFYRAVNVMHEFTTNVINERIQKRRESGSVDRGENDKKQRVLLDALLDLYEEGLIDVEGIRDEINTFMFAGHDTTSSALSWCLYEIGRRPGIQTKLRMEMDSVKGLSITEKISALKYLDCVTKECLRMHSPVPEVGRQVERDIQICGNIIPAGTELTLVISNLHMNGKYWEQPEVFRPERFLSEEYVKRHPYCFTPFSAGSRNCIGQKFALLEVKTYLYYIVSAFEIESLQLYEELELRNAIVSHSENGLNLKFHSRSMF